MATVHLTMGGAMGIGAPVYAAIPRAVQTITSSGTSQQSTISGADGDYASVTASGGAVFFLVGQNPTAASGRGYLVPDGGTKDVGPLKWNDKIAVIDAA